MLAGAGAGAAPASLRADSAVTSKSKRGGPAPPSADAAVELRVVDGRPPRSVGMPPAASTAATDAETPPPAEEGVAGTRRPWLGVVGGGCSMRPLLPARRRPALGVVARGVMGGCCCCSDA